MLRELGRDGRQLFLSLGFEAPHVPLIVPAKYLALYPPEHIPLPQAPAEHDVDIPAIARRWGRNYDIFKKGAPRPEQARAAIAAYYASVSFVDAQIRIVLDALEIAGLADDTIVIAMADHGFHLGEHGMWSKLTLFEQSTRVPLVVRVPGAPANGTVCDEIVELVDLVPSLCDLWGLAVPDAIEGTSFTPLLVDSLQPWKAAAFTLCNRTVTVGRSVRTKRHRYADWGAGVMELYDLGADPWEQVNLAFDPEHRATLERLSKLLEAGWRAALPPVA